MRTVRSLFHRTIFTVAVGMLGRVAEGVGQEARRIEVPPDAACPSCTISLDTVVVLGEGDAAQLSDLVLLEHHRQRWYVGDHENLNVFDSVGRFLRAVGRKGQGPGEYLSVDPRSTPGDTLRIYDQLQMRVTVLSPDEKVVRTVAVGIGATSHVMFGDGSMVMVDPMTTSGAMLHFIDRHGRTRRAFGDGDRGLPSYTNLLYRVVTEADSGRFWSVPWHKYQVSLWDTSGKKELELIRHVDWFTTSSRPRDIFSEEPESVVDAIWYDKTRSLIWLTIRVADPDREANLKRLGAASRGGQHDGAQSSSARRELSDAVFDQIVEVVDFRSGRVVATRRFKGTLFQRFTSDGYLATDIESADGTPRIMVLHPRLIGYSATRRKPSQGKRIPDFSCLP